MTDPTPIDDVDDVDDVPDTRSEIREAAEAAARARLTLYLFTAAFWSYALERMVKTFAQSFGAAAFVGGVAVGLHEIQWIAALSVGGGAAVLSLVTSLIQYNRPPAGSGGDADA